MINNFNIINSTENILFQEYWNKFLKHNPHSLLYKLEYIDYYNSYCKNIINDLSFILVKNNIPLGICFLPIEEFDNTKSISIGGSYLPTPLYRDKKIEKTIFNHIDTIAKENNIQQIKMYTDPNIEFNKRNQFNILKKYNFIEMNNLSLTIDLSNTQQQLWSNLSKSFKSLINQYKKNTTHTLEIMNNKNSNWEIMKQYCLLHRQIAGKHARGIELFKAQYKLIENGFATLFFIKDDTEFISFSLFFHHNKFVAYASSVAKELVKKPPLSHFTLWNANIYFKELNYTLIQYSQPSNFTKYSGFDDITDNKGLSIAQFKRNMGAVPTTMYRGIKFYDKKLLKNHLDTFYDNFEIDE